MLVRASRFRTALLLGAAALLLSACSSDPQKAKAKYLASGEKYMQQKQYSKAAIEFRNAIRIDPQFTDAYFQLSQAAIAQRNWQVAYASLEKLIEMDPGRSDARLERGRLYLAARQFDNAAQDANAVLQKDPKNAMAYVLLAAASLAQQKPEQALDAFSRAAELLPNEANSYLNMAIVETMLRRFPEAEEHLKKGIAVDPTSLRAYTDLANFYRMRANVPAAEEVLQAGIQKNPDATQLYIAWANMVSDTGKPGDADVVLDRLRNQLPKSPDVALAIGEFYLRNKNTDKALTEYRRGLVASPGNIELESRMLDLYLSTNQIDQAVKLDSELLRRAPKDSFVNVQHGRLLLAQGKKDEAIIALQNAVKNAPESAMAHYQLAMAYWQNENLGQANSELHEALKASPSDLPIVLRSIVQLNLLQNRLPDAQVYAIELVQKNPADANDRLLLGSIYLRQGALRPAEEQYQTADHLAPNQANVHLNLGILKAKQNKWKEAEQEFESAKQLDPSNLGVVSVYADYLVSRQEQPKALALVQKFVDSNPNNSQGHVVLGNLEFASKNASGAQAQFEQAIQIDPKNGQAYLQLGGLYRANGQVDASLAQYEKALALQPNSAPLLALVGNGYLGKNDLETAKKYYARALEADSNFPVANANMAWADAEEAKDLDSALAMAQKAKSAAPEMPAITDVLAWVMYKRGNYTGAIPLLEDAVKRAPDSSQYHYHLGLALLAAGQKERGKTQLQAALQINNLRPAEKEQAQQALAQHD